VIAGLPRVVVWLLTRRTPEAWRDFVLGDLEEEFRRRHRAAPAAARRWLWRQTLLCLIVPPPGRSSPRHRTGPVGPANRTAPPLRWPSPLRGDSLMRTLLADLRYAFRVLLRVPSFTIAVIAVLALGIGATTAIFSIVNAVLLRPLPFESPEGLVAVFSDPPQSSNPGTHRSTVSVADYYDWKRAAQQFEAMSIYRFRRFTLNDGNSAEAVLAGAVEPDFFQVLRTQPQLGRTFLKDEDTPAGGHVVVLSGGFWKRHFASAPDVVGRSIRLSGVPYTIVGVMPERVTVDSLPITGRDMWVPVAYTDALKAVRNNRNARVIARLKPGVTPAQAQTEMSAICTQLTRTYPEQNTDWGATVVPLQELIVGDVRLSLVMLLAAVVLVLLIACANVGNLLFARTFARRKELAVRAALGATRARVFQQLLLESLVLAAAGGIAGLLLARASLTAGAALLAAQVPRADEITIDTPVLLFVIVTSVIAGMLAGTMPAVRAGRGDLTDALKEGGRSESAIGVRTRRLLVVCEVALSLVLLMGAAAMGRSLLALRHVDTGFDSQHVLTMRVSLPTTRYDSAARVSTFFTTALQRLRALPGVQAAGAIDDLPSEDGSVQAPVIEGRSDLSARDQPTVAVRKITPGYLRALHIPILRGRDMADTDMNVMLVSRGAAKQLWGDADPIGSHATLPMLSATRANEVIGIVGDVKQRELSDPIVPTVYIYSADHDWRGLTITIRTAGAPLALAQPAAAVVRAIDSEQPVEDVRTMEQVLDLTLTSERFGAWILGVFAAVALVLASVGIYSLLSYIVRGRSREIGIRTALGAGRVDVLRLIVVEGMRPTLIGIAVGVVGALGSAKILEKLVFGVSPSDPLTLVIVGGILAFVALMASLLPAYRAARLDPLIALREK
jgi:putative ABC transport system permease protein